MVSEKHLRENLTTKRLLLRPFQAEDVSDIFAMGGFPTWDQKGPKPFTRRHAEEYIAREILRSWDTEPAFAIIFDSRVIGIIRLVINREDTTAELGYSLDKPYWGQGIMLEAAHKLLFWAFEEYNLVKISASADIANKRSLKVMKTLGMKKEAVLRKEKVIRGVRTDLVWYGILAEEWTTHS